MNPGRLRWTRSLFARTFFLAVLLVAGTNLAWMLIFRLDDSRSRSQAQFCASAVNLVRVALLTSEPTLRPTLLRELSDQEGIRILPREENDRIAPLPNRFMTVTHAYLREYLGEKTRFSVNVNGESGLWVSFTLAPDEADEYWLILPDRAPRPLYWLGWVTLVTLLALVMAWILASRINRPLERMTEAARQVGLGQTPPPLPEEGPEELVRLSRAFNSMSRDLAYNEQERAEILAGISHDLRTPLTRLRLEAELSLPEGAAREGMAADIAQMDAIIAQFLDYARGEAEETAEATAPKPLLEAIAQHNKAIQRPLTLEMEETLPLVEIKPRAVRRALANLVDNAWKHGRPPVRLSGRARDGWLELAVEDGGDGIPAVETERLKQPFTRREGARSGANGTGLGLAIAERVARMHGGILELTQGENGKGLLATLRLPIDGA
ncbi:MAG: HAMP domain-containing protein [Zoogloeaceae bacterium]|jgi:two-component system osmolarity sensor histidine kinase EnvZ|nr:HAMP domain-containing protein [Zoogloeaceae bacterium]